MSATPPRINEYLLLTAAFMVGAVVMSLEMLASRYLNPYFGGTIFTWAALISVVLFALMAGYYLGGAAADRLSYKPLLETCIIVAAVYILLLPLFVDATLEAAVTSIDNLGLAALVGALVVTFVPVTFLATFTPIAIKYSLHSLNRSGRVSGIVFAVATAGNIVGTLGTSFFLIPAFGTRFLTEMLGTVLFLSAGVVRLSRRQPRT
ncbi:MAG: fused MFS/spermidine synthase [Pseudomonadota bacterium]|nr:fused MFS/spermidine synthase [Pseudomonadota bacterium]